MNTANDIIKKLENIFLMKNMNRKKIVYILPLTIIFMISSCSKINKEKNQSALLSQDEFFKDLKHRTFNYFWELADTATFQTPDRYPTQTFVSIAATGFGLTSYIIGVENNYITREQAAIRVLNTLLWLMHSPQGAQAENITGYKGFYYHFLTYGQGKRYKNVELSTIDTGLLMAGILASMSYFDGDNQTEKAIRQIADSLYLRVEWDWAMNNQEWMSMGWHPETGFIESKWTGYNEAMILLIMALGSPTHAINDSAWKSWTKHYEWEKFQDIEHVNFEPLFGHQYSHMFIDFRGIADAYMSEKGLDYFENSKRATLANRAYCVENLNGFSYYNDSVWGLTACDGPADYININNIEILTPDKKQEYFSYRARGASAQRIVDDGTIAPTAAGGSVPFAPQETMKTLYSMYTLYGNDLYAQYGFKDAFNLSFKNIQTGKTGWYDIDYLGIDQGPILIQLANYETEIIWNIMKKNKYITNGLLKAGFSGGWLDNINKEI